MKKLLSLIFLFFLFSLSARAQSSIDIGGEFQRYPHGSIYNLHFAFNTKTNHSLQLRFGYNHVDSFEVKNNYGHWEFGEGWSGGLGYRYYFKPAAKRFFVGATANVWVMKIDMDFRPAGGPAVYPKNTAVLQPALETGYTFLFNKIVFITPYVSAGFQTDFNNKPTNVKYYQDGFKPAIGISAGIRL